MTKFQGLMVAAMAMQAGFIIYSALVSHSVAIMIHAALFGLYAYWYKEED